MKKQPVLTIEPGLKKSLRSLCAAAMLSLGLTAGAVLYANPVQAQEIEGPVFELRTYKATPGNLDKLLTRFRDHTMRIFEKHGMTNVGYWIPVDPELAQDTLVYLLRHDSMEAAQASWRAFAQDPEWREVNDASNRDGAILDSVVRQYMSATDFSQMK